MVIPSEKVQGSEFLPRRFFQNRIHSSYTLGLPYQTYTITSPLSTGWQVGRDLKDNVLYCDLYCDLYCRLYCRLYCGFYPRYRQGTVSWVQARDGRMSSPRLYGRGCFYCRGIVEVLWINSRLIIF